MQIIRRVLLFIILATISNTAKCGLLQSVPLGDLFPVYARQDYGQMQVDRDAGGVPLRIAGREFARGIGAHANSEIVYELDGGYEQFSAWVGVDDSMIPYKLGSVVFNIIVDGKTLFESGVMKYGDAPQQITISVVGARELKLIATDGGDNINGDHADWADAALTGSSQQQYSHMVTHTLKSPKLTASFAVNGQLLALQFGKKGMDSTEHAKTLLVGCKQVGNATVAKTERGGISFTRMMQSWDGKHRCILKDTFTPTANSLRWEIEILGEGAPWSAPIVTTMYLASAEPSRFWTAWYDPEQKTDKWRDPLTPIPMHSMHLTYGDSFALPIATFVDPKRALSLVLSPEDTTLNLALGVAGDGTVSFVRTNRRITPSAPIRFAMDIVPHESDIRCGLAWMVNRYPAYFNPPNPTADVVAGGGAYSGWEGDLDVAKMKRMGFRTNWKASFDFPYMGMYLPPVPKETDRWRRFDADSGGTPLPDVKTYTSRKQMNDYSKRMRDIGFYVLNYFNVTEFGAGLKGRDQIDKKLTKSDAWQDATTYLYTHIGDGLLYNDSGATIGTWGNAVAMDCAGPNYRRHLLEQAKRHIEKLPYSSGICIDRTDWLRYYNSKGDDGVSWVNGKPARSVQTSWQGLMNDLGPMMHKADKVIFVNTLNTRLDIMRQVDGIYAEFGNQFGNFNASALLGLRKPVIAWTASEDDLRADPDLFFQRHLYMGVFPTIPFPANDHTINPGAWAEKYYLDYGPMLDLLRGRKWVLTANPAEVFGGDAKANIFSIPGGYVVPVMFGGSESSVKVVLHGIKAPADLHRCSVQALYPGSELPWNITPVSTANGVSLDVPLKRGCAMVRITGVGGR